MPRVEKVKVTGPFELAIQFDNGKVRVRNFEALSKKGVFTKLSDPKFFAKARVSKGIGTVEWPGGLDLCPDVLYDEGMSKKAFTKVARRKGS